MPPKISPPTHSMKLLVAALRRCVRESGKSLRTLESELAWGHGTLSNVLRGRSEIRLHHVESLATNLGLKPIDLLREAYEGATRDVAPVTVPEDRLSTLIREAVTSALSCPSCSQALSGEQRFE